MRRNYQHTQYFWRELEEIPLMVHLSSFVDVFSDVEREYIHLKRHGKGDEEAAKIMNISRRKLWYHQRNIRLKWVEFLFNSVLHTIKFHGELTYYNVTEQVARYVDYYNQNKGEN